MKYKGTVYRPPLGIFKGTVLFDKLQKGEFVEAGKKENLQEQKAFLENVNLPEAYYWSAHALNSYSYDWFSKFGLKEKMIGQLERNIQTVDDEKFKQNLKKNYFVRFFE